MFLKLVHVQEKDVKIPTVARPGYNKLPEPYHEISEDEFFKRMAHFSADYKEFAQIALPGETSVRNCNTWWFSDGGFLQAFPMQWGLIGGKFKYTEKSRYFRLGCEHDFDRVNVGNCLNSYTCKKCGYSETIDSSD